MWRVAHPRAKNRGISASFWGSIFGDSSTLWVYLIFHALIDLRFLCCCHFGFPFLIVCVLVQVVVFGDSLVAWMVVKASIAIFVIFV